MLMKLSCCRLHWGNFIYWRSERGKGTFAPLPWGESVATTGQCWPAPEILLAWVHIDPCWQIRTRKDMAQADTTNHATFWAQDAHPSTRLTCFRGWLMECYASRKALAFAPARALLAQLLICPNSPPDASGSIQQITCILLPLPWTWHLELAYF